MTGKIRWGNRLGQAGGTAPTDGHAGAFLPVPKPQIWSHYAARQRFDERRKDARLWVSACRRSNARESVENMGLPANRQRPEE
jgi:hypothetical protein